MIILGMLMLIELIPETLRELQRPMAPIRALQRRALVQQMMQHQRLVQGLLEHPTHLRQHKTSVLVHLKIPALKTRLAIPPRTHPSVFREQAMQEAFEPVLLVVVVGPLQTLVDEHLVHDGQANRGRFVANAHVMHVRVRAETTRPAVVAVDQ